MKRKEQIDALVGMMPTYPDSLPVLKAVQLGTYTPEEPTPESILKPQHYPLGINAEGADLSPESQGMLNAIVSSKKGSWITENDISDSFYRDTVVRKALAIAECRGTNFTDYFLYKDYTYRLQLVYSDIALYTPTIITNREIEIPEPEDVDFLQAKADFMCQYRKVKNIQEGFESYRQELLFFEKEPGYFETIEAKLKEIRKALVEDTKQKRALAKEIKALEVSLSEMTEHRDEVEKSAKKVGKFILSRKTARELSSIESELVSIQNNLAILTEKMDEVSTMKLEKTTQLGALRKERDLHTKAREEIGVYLESGLVIPSKTGGIAPWNEAKFNAERHKLVDLARVLIKAFETEAKKAKIPWKFTEKILTFEEFYGRMEKMTQVELGTIIVSSSIPTAQGLVAGYYGKRSLIIGIQSE